jgi:hypothetical protein
MRVACWHPVVPAKAETHTAGIRPFAQLGPQASAKPPPVAMGPRGSLSSGGAERRPGGGDDAGNSAASY